MRLVKTLSIALVLSAVALGAAAQPSPKPERTAAYGSEAKFTSTMGATDHVYAGIYVGKHISAPLQSVQMIWIDKDPGDVFPLVTDGNADWSQFIETLSWDHSGSATKGSLNVGSVRRCDFAGGQGTAYEEVLAYKENALFAYRLDSDRSSVPLPIRDFVAVWTLEDKGDAGTLVVARMYYHEAQDAGGQAAKGVAQALEADFANFANLYGGTFVSM